MSIDTELVVKALRRSPQGLTPFEILDCLLEEPEYKGFSKANLYSKLLPKLNELRDSQVLSHIAPRWSLIGAAENIEYPVDTAESTNGEQQGYLESDQLIQLDNFNEHTENDFLVVDFDSPIQSLGLSVREYNCLKGININTVEEFQNLSDIDLLNIKNFGQKSLDRVKTILSRIRYLPKLTQPESEVLGEYLPSWTSIPSLQIPTNDSLLFVGICNDVSPLLRQVLRRFLSVDHLISAFEADQILLNLDQKIELARTINPLRALRNASQNYLDWLDCLPISTLVDVLIKRKWTQDNLREVYPQQILSVTPPSFHQAIYDDIASGGIPSKHFLTILDEINYLSHPLNDKRKYVFQTRLGLHDGKQRSLEDIGQELGLTRERVRQIEAKAKSELIALNKISLLPQLRYKAIESLHSMSCVSTLQKWTEAIDHVYPAGEIHLSSVVSWFVEFIPEIHVYEILGNQLFYIAPISNQTLSNIQTQISGFWREQKIKISARIQLHQVILPLLPEEISKREKTANTLIEVFCQEPLPDVFSNKKWNMTDYAYYVLYEAGKPLHFKEISERIKQLKTDWKAKNTERAGQGLIDNHPDIIRSGSGIYGLREWGTMEYSHFRQILLDYLSKQPLPVDVGCIYSKLSQTYRVTLTTVKMNLDGHPKLFQKFGYSNFYGLKNRSYELPNQTLLNCLVTKLEAEPLSLDALQQDSDLSQYDRNTIALYLNVSPLFWQIASFRDRKFALPIKGKRLYQHGDATQIVSTIFEQIREPLRPKDFLRILPIYYAYSPVGESAFSRILAEDKSYAAITEALYIPRAWIDEDLSPIIEGFDREKYREIVKFTLGDKSSEINAELVFDWLTFCYQNNFSYRGSLVFEKLDLSQLSEKNSKIAHARSKALQRKYDIYSLDFGQDINIEEVDNNSGLDLEELREQAKSGERASSQGLATLEDGKHYVRYTTLNIEIHIEKWGGSTSAQMRVLKVLYREEMFDPSRHNPILNNTPIVEREKAIQTLYIATLTAYGQVDSYLQIAIGARPSWGVGYRNLKPIIDETT